MSIDRIIESARKAGVSDLASIRGLAARSIALTPHEWTPGASPMNSRLGGLPMLDAATSWPRWRDRSLSFIAQIELASLPPVAAELGFPHEGLLLFFYDAEQSAWGYDPKHAGSFAVVYVPERISSVLVQDWPVDLPEYARYKPCSLAPEVVMTLPPWDAVQVDHLHLSDVQAEAYRNLMDEIAGFDMSSSRALMGGYPDQIQDDMTLQCALVTGGVYCGDAYDLSDPRFPEFCRQAREWRLLLQVPGAEMAGMTWGDVGCLYYWIREEDLKARRFDRSWMILQCA